MSFQQPSGKQQRVQRGVPSGGQFAAGARQEADVDLQEPRPERLSLYQELIARDIGTDEPEMCALVEDFMRMEHPTLDGLSRTQMRVLAREARRDIQVWADGGADAGDGMTLQRYCDAAGLSYPPSLETGPDGTDSDADTDAAARRRISAGPLPHEHALSWADERGHPVYDIDHPDLQAGKVVDRVQVGGTVFHRRRDGVYPNWPYAMRFQANRPLTDDEVRHVAGLVGYQYRASVRGEPLGDPDRDSPYSFIVSADTTKTASDDVGIALEEFEDQLPAIVRDGSPVRKTDRAGAGTKGTRLIDGMGDGLTFELFYDDVAGDD